MYVPPSPAPRRGLPSTVISQSVDQSDFVKKMRPGIVCRVPSFSV